MAISENFKPVYGYQETDPLYEIEYARALYQDQVTRVKREERVRDLLLEDYIRTVKARKSRYDYISLWYDARDQIGKKTKKERPQLEILKEFILEDFLNGDKKFKLTDIFSCGYETYAWGIEFTGYGRTFHIVIPVNANITAKNYKYAHEGQFVFEVQDSPHIWSVLKTSYKTEEIAEFIKEYFADCRDDKEED